MGKKKRFQSGNEIYKEYIPGYDETSDERCLARGRKTPGKEAADLVSTLLGRFNSQVRVKL